MNDHAWASDSTDTRIYADGDYLALGDTFFSVLHDDTGYRLVALAIADGRLLWEHRFDARPQCWPGSDQASLGCGVGAQVVVLSASDGSQRVAAVWDASVRGVIGGDGAWFIVTVDDSAWPDVTATVTRGSTSDLAATWTETYSDAGPDDESSEEDPGPPDTPFEARFENGALSLRVAQDQWLIDPHDGAVLAKTGSAWSDELNAGTLPDGRKFVTRIDKESRRWSPVTTVYDADGSLAWSMTGRPWTDSTGAVVVEGGAVGVGRQLVDLETGKANWQLPKGFKEPRVTWLDGHRHILVDYFPREISYYALVDSTGKLVWDGGAAIETIETIYLSPEYESTLASDVVMTFGSTSSDGTSIMAVDPITQRQLWQNSLPDLSSGDTAAEGYYATSATLPVPNGIFYVNGEQVVGLTGFTEPMP